MQTGRSIRHGFTLLELLVTMAVIGTLASLSLPAVQFVREASRKAQCQNNQKQLALALHNYHDSFQRLPSPAYCGVPGSSSIQHCHTWIESLLPYIDQQAKYDQIDFHVANHWGVNPSVLNNWAPAILQCPSDADAGLLPNSREPLYTPGTGESLGASYIPSAGPLHMNSCPIPARNPNINCLSRDGARLNVDAPGMFAGGWIAYRFEDCTDGLSQTCLLGETLPIYCSFQMYFASHLHIGSHNPPPNYHLRRTACPKSPTSRGPNSPPNLICYADMSGFKSAHAGGVFMAFADGRVQFISQDIDYAVWCHLGNKSDGTVLGNF